MKEGCMDAKRFKKIRTLADKLRSTLPSSHDKMYDVIKYSVRLDSLSEELERLSKKQAILEYLLDRGDDDAEIGRYREIVSGIHKTLQGADRIESNLKVIEAQTKAEIDAKAVKKAARQVNPWLPEHLNLTEQGRIYKTDPTLARGMIIASGRNPALYGL